MHFANFALAREKNQDVAEPVFASNFIGGGDNRFGHAARFTHRFTAFVLDIGLGMQRPIANVDRIAATFDIDHRRLIEVFGKARGVDGCRGDNQLEVAALSQQLLQIAKKKVYVKTALVGLIED